MKHRLHRDFFTDRRQYCQMNCIEKTDHGPLHSKCGEQRHAVAIHFSSAVAPIDSAGGRSPRVALTLDASRLTPRAPTTRTHKSDAKDLDSVSRRVRPAATNDTSCRGRRVATQATLARNASSWRRARRPTSSLPQYFTAFRRVVYCVLVKCSLFNPVYFSWVFPLRNKATTDFASAFVAFKQRTTLPIFSDSSRSDSASASCTFSPSDWASRLQGLHGDSTESHHDDGPCSTSDEQPLHRASPKSTRPPS